jgi:hypothetical protein
MTLADPTYREQLRDLPTGYLLEQLADDAIDRDTAHWVLRERGLSQQEIEQRVRRWRDSRWPRPYTLWSWASRITLFNLVIVSWFNVSGLYRLFSSSHPFRGGLLLLSIGCVLAGFVVGYKLTACVYQGRRDRLYSGFPLPIGHVELPGGEERLPGKTQMYLYMSLNALTGVNLILFPLTFIFIMMS